MSNNSLPFNKRISPRYFHCPDDISRIVSLENWYWLALDWLCTDKGEDEKEIISFCYEGSRLYEPDPEGEFRDTLAYYIHRLAQFHLKQEDRLANDDWYNPEWLEACEE